MQSSIRFVPTAEDIALAEEIQERIAAREKKRKWYSWRHTAGGLAVGLFLGVPGVLLLSQVSGTMGWLTAYMVLAPWILAFLIVPFDRRRRAKAA
ncbi:hypothetical protein SNE32_15930, partial [Lysobacter sp. D1-1-M9]|uniref:hypothetical protein n=1 Tax=Novilysobacter longmucuonensis TaxID=3098603 RepID=UPI002FC6126E